MPLQLTDEQEELDYPSSVNIPPALVPRAREYAALNHGGQTLERLRERCGLDPTEFFCVVMGFEYQHDIVEEKTIRRFCKMLDASEPLNKRFV